MQEPARKWREVKGYGYGYGYGFKCQNTTDCMLYRRKHLRTTQQGHYAAMQPACVTTEANRTTPGSLKNPGNNKQNITDGLPDGNHMCMLLATSALSRNNAVSMEQTEQGQQIVHER
ncbi:hypothetical protein N7533_000018 [Penicillium manginii]|uniref:uncharacterized protein n=1 Tax=Penicillium manginii TaxID=203109 RepID=UPI002548B4B6|nr:uncharacterized protein N7533_000018 [Penicillium manginii]KAJ5767435.1 hypothetical protein N7533_000018 [Penicillium manginii]